MIIGITGGIACGKSSVAGLLTRTGAGVISTDAIGHELLRTDSPVFAQIALIAEDSLLDEEGDISRKKLGDVVFANPSKRELLNSIIHPEIRKRWKSRVDTAKKNNPAIIVFIEIPLLFETEAQTEFDKIVCVASSRETQIARLQSRRNLTREQATSRISAQMPTENKADLSDYVIWNEYGLNELERQVGLLLDKIALVEEPAN